MCKYFQSTCVAALLFMVTVYRIARPASVPDQFYLGTNFSGICDWGTEPVWKDYMKQSRTWCPQRPGVQWGNGWPLAVDSLGWITSLDADQTADCPLFGSTSDNWTSMHPDTTYYVLYDGEGTVTLSNAESYTVVSPGKIRFKPKPSAAPFLQITATAPQNYVRNIRVVSAANEASYGSEPWDPEFLKRWVPFPVIRFMDWGATNDSPIRHWSERTQPDAQTQAAPGGVALEHMIDYCNRTLSEPWFCMPHMADDNYIRRFATMVRDHLDPRLTTYVEYSNEVWNSIFEQTHYCDSVGSAQGLDPTGTHPWEAGWRYSGRRSKEIFKIWEEVFGNTDRFVRVIASQMNTYVTECKLETDSVYNYTDAIAIAPYFGGKYNDAGRMNEIAALTVDQLLDSCLDDIRGDVRTQIKAHADLCKKYNTDYGTDLRLIAYEGGQHLTAWNTNQAATDLFTAANRSPRMKELYLTYFEMWDTLGGTLFAQFSSLCSPGPYGAWCVLENVDQDPATAPKYQALLELIAAHPAPQKATTHHSTSHRTYSNAPGSMLSITPFAGNRLGINIISKGTFIFEIFDLKGKRHLLHSLKGPGPVMLDCRRLPREVFVARATDLISGTREQTLLRLQN